MILNHHPLSLLDVLFEITIVFILELLKDLIMKYLTIRIVVYKWYKKGDTYKKARWYIVSEMHTLRNFRELTIDENKRVDALLEEAAKSPEKEKGILAEVLNIAFGDSKQRVKILKRA